MFAWLRFIISLFKSPQAVFVFGILFSWYTMVMVPAMLAAYYLFKGLEKSGILSSVRHFIHTKIMDALFIAQDCSPLLVNLSDFLQCLNEH